MDVDLSSSNDESGNKSDDNFDDSYRSDGSDWQDDDSEPDVEDGIDWCADQDETGDYNPDTQSSQCSDADIPNITDDDDSLYITDDEEYLNRPCLGDELDGVSNLESEPDEAAEDEPKSTGRKSARTANSGRHATKKFVPVPESFDNWLARINREHPVTDADKDEDVKRFRANWKELVSRLHSHIKGYNGFSSLKKQESRVSIHYNVRVLFDEKEAKDISDNHIAHTPLIAQKILGNPDLAPEDILRLPEGVPELLLWGVYQIVPARYQLEDIVNAPHPQYQFNVIDTVRFLRDGVDPASAEEFRLYAGSATNKKEGLRSRGAVHILQTHRDELKSDLAVHAYGIQKDVVNHHRVTAA